jgi:acetyltransferase-like isoleucine patch superfamily enzyme
VLADNVWIGARAVVLGGARIGEGSVVGAAAVVDFEVPPYSLAAGNPARILGPIGTAAR